MILTREIWSTDRPAMASGWTPLADGCWPLMAVAY
jgi:hypothetical protein